MNDQILELTQAAEKERDEAIQSTNDAATKRIAFLNKLARLKATKYPDLRIEYSPDGTVEYYCSSKINGTAASYYIRDYLCMCHPSDHGDDITITFFFKDGDITIYSSPRNISIGSCGSYCDIEERRHWEIDSDWKETLQEMGIPETLIKEIEKEITQNLQSSCEFCKDES